MGTPKAPPGKYVVVVVTPDGTELQSPDAFDTCELAADAASAAADRTGGVAKVYDDKGDWQYRTGDQQF